MILPFTAFDPGLRNNLRRIGSSVIADTESTTLLGVPQGPCLPFCRRYDRIIPLMFTRLHRGVTALEHSVDGRFFDGLSSYL